MKKILLPALLLLGGSALLIAQTPPAGDGPGPRGDGPRRPPPPVMIALDIDEDGELSASEIAQASQSLLVLDLNKDGKLTRDELRPLPPPGGVRPEGAPPARN